ncbi:MFS transporter [Ktedonobacter robiniae]|uniref:Multidrug efflux pump Tap n=1 Tax=Ktedonobacter robiniae TaxID=2778365 RepID=A0ABQ3V3S4_9CHLR|nr:MFS transporter [Ktedonobacter robiniae]GHO59611.1 MFS transporter [Ktedonobacter robiniae]
MNNLEVVTEISQEKPAPQRVMPLYALFAGNIISYVGNALTGLAVPWFVLQTTGSATQTAMTAFCSALPMVLSSFFGGLLVDRLGYKRTSILSDIASGVSVGLVPLLYHTLGLPFWLLLLLVFLGGLLKAPGMNARGSLVPDLARLARMRLERTNAISDGLSRVSSFLGAPLAAILISWLGASNLLWFDALSFFVSSLLIGLLVPFTPPILAGSDAKTGAALHHLCEGIRYISGNSLVLSIIVTVMITNLLDASFGAVVAPVYVRQVFHSPLPLGLLMGAFGGAAFLGTLIFGAIGHTWPRRLTFGIGFTIGGALRFWILLVPILPLLIACNAVMGFAIAPVNPLIDTVAQEILPQEMRARVFGVAFAGAMMGIPLGAFVGGFLISWLGLQQTLVLMGTFYLIATLSFLVNPAMKQMDQSKKA